MDDKTWTIEPTAAEWKAFFEAVGRHVADPSLKAEIEAVDGTPYQAQVAGMGLIVEVEATGGALHWAQATGMGLELADLFSQCYESKLVTEAVARVDLARKTDGIKTAYPWRDAA